VGPSARRSEDSGRISDYARGQDGSHRGLVRRHASDMGGDAVCDATGNYAHSSLTLTRRRRERAQDVMKESVESLVEALFSLEEPWRSRFLVLVGNWATGWSRDGRQPGREEIAAWLQADLSLCREVRLLLDAWRKPER